MKVFVKVFVFVFVLIFGSLPGTTMLPALAQGEAPIPGTIFIHNDQIRIGINLAYGGAIVHASTLAGANLINNNDLGRQLQIALYGGPLDYSQAAQNTWVGLGWNPIQAGSTYGSPAQVLDYWQKDGVLYAKTQGKQFAYPNEPGEATIEHWISLEDNTAKVHVRLALNRSDHTPYDARPQEWPCLYGNPSLTNYYYYSGDQPFTNAPLTLLTPQMEMKDIRSITEPWMAMFDQSGNGIGLYTPNTYQFTAAFFGKDYGGDQYSASSSYIASTPFAVLDHNGIYEFDYVVILGRLPAIRQYVYAHENRARLLTYNFSDSRQGWYFFNCHDQGWPVKNGLNVIMSNTERDQILSPFGFWKGSENNKITIRAAFSLNTNTFRLHWRKTEDYQFLLLSDRYVDFPIINDGVVRDYVIDLKDNPNWNQTSIAQISLRPVTGSISGSVNVVSAEIHPGNPATVSSRNPTPTPTQPSATTAQGTFYVKSFDCKTGQLTIGSTRRATTKREISILGIQAWTIDSTFLIPEWIRAEKTLSPLQIQIRDQNQIEAFTFDLRPSCLEWFNYSNYDAPVTTPTSPSSVTVASPPTLPTSVSTVAPAQDLMLTPQFNCFTGTVLIRTNLAPSGSFEYAIPGIRAFSEDSLFTVPSWTLLDPRNDQLTLMVRDAHQQVSSTVSIRAYCPSIHTTYQPATTNPACNLNEPLLTPMSATVCIGQPIILTPIGATGATYNWEGSSFRIVPDGGIEIRQTTAGVYTYQVRQQVGTCQSERASTTVTVIDCSTPTTTTILTPPSGATASVLGLRVEQPLINCQSRKITIITYGGNGQEILYSIPGIAQYLMTSQFTLPASWPQEQPIVLIATQSLVDARRIIYWNDHCPTGSGRVATTDSDGAFPSALIPIYPNPVQSPNDVEIYREATAPFEVRPFFQTDQQILPPRQAIPTARPNWFRLSTQGWKPGTYLLQTDNHPAIRLLVN